MRVPVSGKAHALPRRGASARLWCMRTLTLCLLLLSVAACGRFAPDRDRGPDIAVTEGPGAEVLRPQGRPGAGTLPAGTPPGAGADGSVPAPPPPAADGLLGETLAGLGATGGPGLWLMTGLVTEPRQGRVETAGGGRLSVELRPSGAAPSAGSTLSVQAMQRLQLPLGQLANLRVYAE